MVAAEVMSFTMTACDVGAAYRAAGTHLLFPTRVLACNLHAVVVVVLRPSS